jgi:2-hydroxy fatty acid dioxygenase
MLHLNVCKHSNATTPVVQFKTLDQSFSGSGTRLSRSSPKTFQMSLFNFDVQFVKYGEFHANKINQVIHIIFVPAILWSCQVWFSTFGKFISWQFDDILPINVSFILSACYCLYFILLHKIIGFLITPAIFGLLYSSNQFLLLQNLPYGLSPMQLSTAVHVSSWVFQILGHQVFEGRGKDHGLIVAPAFTKDPIQALVLGIGVINHKLRSLCFAS